MKRERTYKFISALLVIFTISFGDITRAQKVAIKAQPKEKQIEQPLEDLPNFKQIDEKFYRGGRPSKAGIDELKRRGIKTIINLRSNEQDGADEEAQAKAAGLKFFKIPLNIWFRPKNSQMKKIMAVIDDKENQPVFVHCNLGADRTGMVTAIYQISHQGWTAKQANEEAKESGLGKWQFWMRDYINDFYRDFVKEKK
jgi:protein tyrosine/serine phosphatase